MNAITFANAPVRKWTPADLKAAFGVTWDNFNYYSMPAWAANAMAASGEWARIDTGRFEGAVFVITSFVYRRAVDALPEARAA